MIFKGYGDLAKPVVLLLHGGGLSDWSLEPIAKRFSEDYYVVTAIIDGHGEDSGCEFCSIEVCAQKVMDYIERQFGGQIHGICGLSIGAQIVCEILARDKGIVDVAVIESALVCPLPWVTALMVPMYHVAYGLIKQRWFSRLQGKSLCVPAHLLERYYQDSMAMSKESLIRMTISNGNYRLKPGIGDTQAKVLVIVGEKEIPVMQKSAKLIQERIHGSTLLMVPKLKHGEFSLVHGEEYIQTTMGFLKP